MTPVAIAALLVLAACSAPQLERACENIEPFRPAIRGVIDLATEGATVVPFIVTSQIHCADIEALAERRRSSPAMR